MIKKALIITLLFTSTFTFTYAQKTKLGHINSKALLQVMPQRDSLEKVLEQYANNLQDKLDNLKEEYSKKVQDYQAQSETMSDPVKQSNMQEINDLQNRISEFQKTAQQDLQTKQSKLLQPILDKAKKAIDEVAKAHDFTYILDTSVGVVLYDGGGVDILPMVMKKLGLEGTPVPTTRNTIPAASRQLPVGN